MTLDDMCKAVGMEDHPKLEEDYRNGKINDVPDLIELLHVHAASQGGGSTAMALFQLPSNLCSILPPLKARLYSIANSPPPGPAPPIVTIVISRLFFDAADLASSDLRDSPLSTASPGSPLLSLPEQVVVPDTTEEFAEDLTERLLAETGDNPKVHLSRTASSARSFCESGGKVTHLGVCTSFLLNHSLFGYIPVRVVEEESFHLPPVDDPSPIVFVSIGSGAAPMFAFLEELLDRGTFDCPKQIYFFWGVRKVKDLYGLKLLKRVMREIGRINICISFSGEEKKLKVDGSTLKIVPGKKERITTTMKRTKWAQMLARIVSQKGYVYLCGHPMLETSVRGVLEYALSSVGGFSPEQSSARYEKMVVDGRLKSDCFYSGSVFDPTLPSIPYSEVARHTRMDDLWWIYKDQIFNVTRYLKLHPVSHGFLSSLLIARGSCIDLFIFLLH